MIIIGLIGGLLLMTFAFVGYQVDMLDRDSVARLMVLGGVIFLCVVLIYSASLGQI